MRTLIFIFFVLTSVVTLNGQQYVPFPTKEAHWNIYLEYGVYGLNPEISILKYYIGGDTILNDISYKKLLRIIGDSSFFETYYIGAFREKNMKVYYQGLDYLNNEHINDNEILLYDFTKNIEDTIFHVTGNSHFYSVINDIDSVVIGSRYRKRYEIVSSTNYNHESEYWIEGIGSMTNGLLGHVTEIPTCCYSFWEHICYKDQDIEHVTPNFTSCYPDGRISDKIDPFLYRTQLEIYPNPIVDIIHVNVLVSSKSYTVKLFGLSGNLLYIDAFTENSFDLDLCLPVGYYILKVSNDLGNIIGIKKLVK